ncbi:MAG TPA: PIN domain-containing protein [Pyrinomonadaceae bacterium]|jgi:rRNA-processing protein FCF1|nr:PIN domain-containing protein [Pyrinomonadaceae bacterium]
MADYFTDLLNSYRAKGAFVDANLLLVYFVGSYDRRLITKFKRTIAYTEDDFDLLTAIIAFFSNVVTTPNVLTEVNGLSNQLPESSRSSYYSEFANRVDTLEEHFIESRLASHSSHFTKFGLTDSGIIELVKDKYLVITDDLRLAHYCENIGVDVINFNHIRTMNWNP